MATSAKVRKRTYALWGRERERERRDEREREREGEE